MAALEEGLPAAAALERGLAPAAAAVLHEDEARWRSERPSYYIQTGSAFENPYGVPWRELARLIVEQPSAMVAQTVFGKLVPDDGAVFSFELLQGLFRGWAGGPISSTVWIDAEVQEQAGLVRQFLRDQGRAPVDRFCGGADLARKKDATVIFVLDLDGVPERPARVVYYRRVERCPWPVIYAEIALASYLFDCEILVDSTGAGDVVCEELDNRSYCPAHHVTNEVPNGCVDHEGTPRGCRPEDYRPIPIARFQFSESTKSKLITNLAQVLGHGFDPGQPEKEYGLIRAPRIIRLQEQLPIYRWADRKLETDEVMGLSLAAWAGLRDMVGPASIGSSFG